MATTAVRIRLEGVEPLLARLQALDKGTRNRILRKALRKGAKPVIQAERQLVPKDTGTLKRSIGSKSKTYRKGGVVVFIIGPRNTWTFAQKKGAKKLTLYKPGKYAALVDKGTKRSRPKPFREPAMNRAKSAAQAAIVGEITRGLEALARGEKP